MPNVTPGPGSYNVSRELNSLGWDVYRPSSAFSSRSKRLPSRKLHVIPTSGDDASFQLFQDRKVRLDDLFPMHFV
jgi:hypothetical protein